MRRRALAAAVTALLLVPAAAFGQWARGTVSGGMGGTGAVWARGVDAVDFNPANLAFSRGWSLSLVDLGAAGLLSGTSLGDLREIATAGGDGDGAVVDRLPEGGLRVTTLTDGFALSLGAEAADVPSPKAPFPTLGLSWGSWAFRMRSRVLGEAALAREVADLTVNGFNPERIREYAARETGFRMASFTEMTLGYGHAVAGRLGLGASLRLVKGHRLAQGRVFEPEIDLTEETLRIAGVAVEAPGGTGWGVDLGLALDLGRGVQVSLAAENVAQRMAWDEALRSHEAVFTDGDFDGAELADLLDRFDDNLLDPQGVSLAVYEAARGLFTQAYFPTVYRAGVGWASPGTRVEVNASAVSPRGRHRAPWEQRVAAGVEQRLGPLALRAGVARATDGITAVTAGGGLRLGAVRMDWSAGKFLGSHEGVSWDGLAGSVALSLTGGGR